MKRSWSLVLTAAAVLAIGQVSLAKDADKAADKAAAKAEKAADKAVAKAEKAMTDWDKKHESRMAELSEARKSGDKAKSGPAAKELGTLKSEREALDNQYDDAIQGLLTDGQRKAYAGNSVYAAMMLRYKKLGVTETQAAEIRTRSTKLGETLVGKDAKAADEARAAMRSSIDAEVLTAEQREMLKPKPKEKAATPAAPK